MMTRLVAIVLILHCSAALANDYIVRVEKIGYVDQPAMNKKPREIVFHTIEILARPGKSFRGKIKLGTETVTLAGTLQPTENGEFTTDVRYRHIVDTGETIPTADGRGKPRLNETAFESTIATSVGKPTDIGGTVTTRNNKLSKTRYVLLISRYNPAN